VQATLAAVPAPVPLARQLQAAGWKQVHAPVLLIYGEHDQLEPVDESLAKIEASLDGVKTPLCCCDRAERAAQPDGATGSWGAFLLVEGSSWPRGPRCCVGAATDGRIALTGVISQYWRSVWFDESVRECE
jgi:hypothetical protein